MRNKLTVGSLIYGRSTSLDDDNSSVKVVKKSDSALAKGNTEQVNQQMIEFMQNGIIAKVMPSKNKLLLDEALNNDIDINYKCRKGSCGKCQIRILHGIDLLASPTIKEKQKLGDLLIKNYRLACQAMFK